MKADKIDHKIKNAENFKLQTAPLFWSLVCARSLERRWRRLSNKQGHSKHAATHQNGENATFRTLGQRGEYC